MDFFDQEFDPGTIQVGSCGTTWCVECERENRCVECEQRENDCSWMGKYWIGEQALLRGIATVPVARDDSGGEGEESKFASLINLARTKGPGKIDQCASWWSVAATRL